MKLCIDCKHYSLTKADRFNEPEQHGCYYDTFIDIVDGSKRGKIYECSVMRSDSGSCGPAGRFWEPKDGGSNET